MARGRPRKNPAPAPAQATQSGNQDGAFGPNFHGLPPVQAVPQTFGEGSTTEALFGAEEPTQEQTQEAPEPVKEEQQPEPTPEPKPEEPKVEEPQKEKEPEADDIESWFEKNRDKKKKIKYGDGQVEEEMSLAELIKNVQTWKHLGHISNNIGQQRRQLDQERAQLEAMRRQNQRPQQTEEPDPLANLEPQKAEDRRIMELEAQIAALSNTLAPTVYQTARQKVDEELKSEGFTDFLSYIPKLEIAIAGIQNPQMRGYYDTPEGAKDLYFRLKAKEMAEAKATASSAPPTPEAPPPKNRPIVKVDGGSPSGSSVTDDMRARYKAAFERFQANPKDQRAFSELMALKGYPGG
jgi:hypothetical protein